MAYMISGWALRIRKINCQSGPAPVVWLGGLFPPFLFTAAYDNSKIRNF